MRWDGVTASPRADMRVEGARHPRGVGIPRGHKSRRRRDAARAGSMLKILGSEVPRSTAVLCTDSLVARPRHGGTKIRREVVLIRVLNSLGGNKDY